MKLSELISLLEAHKASHGDIPVATREDVKPQFIRIVSSLYIEEDTYCGPILVIL